MCYSPWGHRVRYDLATEQQQMPLRQFLGTLSNAVYFILFIFGYAGSSLLCRLFSSCGKKELLFRGGMWALHVMASLVTEHML